MCYFLANDSFQVYRVLNVLDVPPIPLREFYGLVLTIGLGAPFVLVKIMINRHKVFYLSLLPLQRILQEDNKSFSWPILIPTTCNWSFDFWCSLVSIEILINKLYIVRLINFLAKGCLQVHCDLKVLDFHPLPLQRALQEDDIGFLWPILVSIACN